jgi:hypothetical protein
MLTDMQGVLFVLFILYEHEGRLLVLFANLEGAVWFISLRCLKILDYFFKSLYTP